jgi:hypothetical protein
VRDELGELVSVGLPRKVSGKIRAAAALGQFPQCARQFVSRDGAAFACEPAQGRDPAPLERPRKAVTAGCHCQFSSTSSNPR